MYFASFLSGGFNLQLKSFGVLLSSKQGGSLLKQLLIDEKTQNNLSFTVIVVNLLDEKKLNLTSVRCAVQQ